MNFLTWRFCALFAFRAQAMQKIARTPLIWVRAKLLRGWEGFQGRPQGDAPTMTPKRVPVGASVGSL